MLVKILKFYVLTFFKAKKLLGADEKQLGVRERLMAGSMAGVASQTSIYPLEVTWLIYNFFATYEVMKSVWMFIRKFEFNSWRRPTWACLELYLSPKRHHLKWKQTNFQLLFREESCGSGLDSRSRCKSSLKTGIRALLLSFFPQDAPKRLIWQLMNSLSETRILDFYLYSLLSRTLNIPTFPYGSLLWTWQAI